MNKINDIPLRGSRIRTPEWALLTNRNFGCLWFAQVISQIGDGVTKVALIWFVYELTGSVLKMAVVGLLQTIPPLLLGPLVGVYIDRLPKKPVMIGVDLIRALLIVMIPGLYALEALTLERLYWLVFFTAIFSTVFGPALAAGIPLLVKPSQLMAANALIQSTTNIGVLVGPASSGLMIALIGTHNVLYFDAATFVLSAFFLLAIKSPRLSAVSPLSGGKWKFTKELRTGLQFVFSQQPTIPGLMLITVFFTMGASGFVYLLPVFVKDHMDLGSVWLGSLWSSLGGGMLLASWGLARIKQGGIRQRLRIIAGAMSIGAVFVIGLTLFPFPALALVMVGIIGSTTAIFTPIVWSLLQELTPGNLQGRVFTVVSTAGMAAAAAGIPAVGWIADTAGSTMGFFGIAIALFGTALISASIGPRRTGWKKYPEKGLVIRNAHLRWAHIPISVFQRISRHAFPLIRSKMHLIYRNDPIRRPSPVSQILSVTRTPPDFQIMGLGKERPTPRGIAFHFKREVPS